VPEKRIVQCVSIVTAFLPYFPYFEKNKSRLMRSPCCLCMSPSLLGSGLVNMFPQQWIHNRILLGTLFFMSPFFPPYHSAATALLLLAMLLMCNPEARFKSTACTTSWSTPFPTSSQYTAKLWNWFEHIHIKWLVIWNIHLQKHTKCAVMDKIGCSRKNL
jgi:hypothetical protein